MYHQVADSECDPWGNCVSPDNFKEHLEVINRLARTLRLGELTESLHSGKTLKGGIALTFDDGYADNYHIARPLLEAHETPATFFLVSGQISSENAYWWDELTDILLRPGRLPETLEIALGGVRHEFQLNLAEIYSCDDLQADSDVRAWAAKSGSRLNFYYRVWKLLRSLPQDERSEVLDKIRIWTGETRSRAAGQITITDAEAHTLASEDLIEIGSHSQSHPSLPDLDPSRQRQELANSRVTLEEIIERPVRSFAYPYGDYSRDTLDLVKETGYACACTITPGHVRSGYNPCLLPRFAVSDWSGDEFERQLSKF
jgi:peptidoglycan/xylan/chitin deacetylase (PgdA/CDA1 family)